MSKAEIILTILLIGLYCIEFFKGIILSHDISELERLIKELK